MSDPSADPTSNSGSTTTEADRQDRGREPPSSANGETIPNGNPGSSLTDNGGNDDRSRGETEHQPKEPCPKIMIHLSDEPFGRNDQMSPSCSLLGSASPSFRRRCDSMTGAEDGDHNESKVLVIYTGGTIGMIRNDEDSKYKTILINVK